MNKPTHRKNIINHSFTDEYEIITYSTVEVVGKRISFISNVIRRSDNSLRTEITHRGYDAAKQWHLKKFNHIKIGERGRNG